jgi:hypothetical protein
MSHSFKYSRLSRYDSELKLPSPPVTQSWFARSLLGGWALLLIGTLLARSTAALCVFSYSRRLESENGDDLGAGLAGTLRQLT